jgi:2-polyprenyl-3-methyl-5-hydroxy-6-metoxy-1,4-benzoquinol methylase
VDSLAALAAYIRIETEQLPADSAVRELLSAIAAELVDDQVTAESIPVVGLARTFISQAAELIENPGRRGSWDRVDVPLLESIGRLSISVLDALLVAEQQLPGLAERLAAPGAAFLDVGTGTGWLAIAIARSHPNLKVVGLDSFEPALDLAKANVQAEDLAERIELRLQDATQLDEPATYDAIWLPMPFLPAGIVPAVLVAAARSLRPGGWLFPGTFASAPDRLSQLLTDLRTVRSGGYPWQAEELIDALTAAQLTDTHEITRTWQAPVRLYAGQRC